ncbi:hypothetical protein EV360DRAFT_68260 [Lentinula raphanica]|nr:hypothetical protein EV360DRAFT_68260 [Lentinula raphanica]
MRSGIIYALYVAVTLLRAASVAASPLPAGAQSRESSEQKFKRVHDHVRTIRFGLLDVEEGEENPVDPDAGFSERRNARYLTCFGPEICLYFIHPGPGPGSVGFTKPQLLKPKPKPTLVPRTEEKKRNGRVDLIWYQVLEGIALQRSLIKTQKNREDFRQGLEALCNSELSTNTISKFDDEKSLIFALFDSLKSSLVRVKDSAELTDKEVHEKVGKILYILKADSTDQDYQAFKANRRRLRDIRERQARSQAKKARLRAQALQDSMTSGAGDVDEPSAGERTGEPSGSSWTQEPPVGNDSYPPKSNLAASPSLSDNNLVPPQWRALNHESPPSAAMANTSRPPGKH